MSEPRLPFEWYSYLRSAHMSPVNLQLFVHPLLMSLTGIEYWWKEFGQTTNRSAAGALYRVLRDVGKDGPPFGVAFGKLLLVPSAGFFQQAFSMIVIQIGSGEWTSHPLRQFPDRTALVKLEE